MRCMLFHGGARSLGLYQRGTVFILWCVVLAFATGVSGGVIFTYEQDFTGDDGTLPEDWAAYLSRTPGEDVMFNILDNQLRAYRETPLTGTTLAALFTGDVDGHDATEWTDYTVSAIVSQNTGGNQIQLLARTQAEAHSPLGYRAQISSGTGTNYLRILRGDVLLDESFNAEDPSWFADNTTYRMTFTVVGDQLSMEVFGQDGLGEYTVSMDHIATTDATYSQGMPGVRCYFSGSSTRSIFFDDFVVQGIPEPSTAALLLLAGAGVLRLRRRRR